MNNGSLKCELEAALNDDLSVKYLFFISKNTITMQIAVKAMDLHREIITTPFSYVATTPIIVQEGCRLVFGDIDQKHYV